MTKTVWYGQDEMSFQAAKMLAKQILLTADKHDWTLQGMGLLRMHIENFRLHVWDQRFAFPGVSFIHDHQQWGLQSLIISGKLKNVKYVEAPNKGEKYMHVRLMTGVDCKFLEEPTPIYLKKDSVTTYYPGDIYSQFPSEIHQTIPVDGTVTFIRKIPTKDAESAKVFWLANEQWGSAEPRKATKSEVWDMANQALKIWQ